MTAFLFKVIIGILKKAQCNMQIQSLTYFNEIDVDKTTFPASLTSGPNVIKQITAVKNHTNCRVNISKIIYLGITDIYEEKKTFSG